MPPAVVSLWFFCVLLFLFLSVVAAPMRVIEVVFCMRFFNARAIAFQSHHSEGKIGCIVSHI